jgi:hypothetical protein
MKVLLLNLAPPVFLVGFVLFAKFVARRLPADRMFGWRLVCTGGLITIAGMGVAVYVAAVEVGATVGMVGIAIAAIGLWNLFLPP